MLHASNTPGGKKAGAPAAGPLPLHPQPSLGTAATVGELRSPFWVSFGFVSSFLFFFFFWYPLFCFFAGCCTQPVPPAPCASSLCLY